MTPDNGSPESDIFPGNYELSFYPTRNIPRFGYIEITFPVNEFKDSTAFLNNPLRCYVSGSITTFKSCEIVGTSTVIKLTLDTEMKVEPGNDKYFLIL